MNKKSPMPMFVLGGICVLFVAVLSHAMPHGPPPLEPDGSISLATFIKYESQVWKGPWIAGVSVVAFIFFALGIWRWFHHDKGTDVRTRTA
jgi:hypothetical protein